MWPRLVGRGNNSVAAANAAASHLLQCGRGWLAAETPWRIVVETSMNLLQCGRGWLAAETRRWTAPAGSAARGFNVAAAGWPRKRRSSSSRLRLSPGFNVAAAGWPRKLGVAGLPARAAEASMWPRLVGRGNPMVGRAPRRLRRASMWPRLVGRGNSSPDRRRARAGTRFNVAAAGWPRKPPTTLDGASRPTPLQCGRGWLAAETLALAEADLRPGLASMWPRLVGRGNASSILANSTRAWSLQCGRGWLAAETSTTSRPTAARPAASMWPRLVGRGNRDRRDRPRQATRKLQCGRGWLAAETARPCNP